MKRVALASSMLMVGVLAASPRALADDEGIKIGEGRLHPFLALGGRWDSFASVDGNGKALSDFLFDIDPGLKLNIPSSILSLTLNADVDEVLYATYTSLDRTLVNGLLGLSFFDQGVVGFNLGDMFTRSNNGNVSSLPFAVIADLNDATAKIPIRPGGGALTITPGYDFIYQHFESFGVAPVITGSCPNQSPYCNPANAGELDYMEHRGSLEVSWKFLPKTAVLLSGEFLNIDYLTQTTASSGGSGNAPMNMFDATLGLTGLLTTHFEIIARAGYAQTMLSSVALTDATGLVNVGDAHTPIGQLQLGYLFSETGAIRIGFVRVLLPVPTTLAYYEDNRPYVQIRLAFGRLVLHLDASVDINTYAQGIGDTGASRTDELLHIDVGPEVEVARWFRVGAGYNLTSLGSNDSAAFGAYNGESPVIGTAGYANHEVYLRLTFVY